MFELCGSLTNKQLEAVVIIQLGVVASGLAGRYERVLKTKTRTRISPVNIKDDPLQVFYLRRDEAAREALKDDYPMVFASTTELDLSEPDSVVRVVAFKINPENGLRVPTSSYPVGITNLSGSIERPEANFTTEDVGFGLSSIVLLDRVGLNL